MTTARDIMSGGADCARAEDTVVDAARRMSDLGVGALPICDDDRLTGMITDRDIVVQVLGIGKDPALTTVAELAQAEVVAVGADDSVEDVVATMTRHKVRRLPVVDGHTLVGVVALADAARALADPTAGQLLDALSTD